MIAVGDIFLYAVRKNKHLAFFSLYFLSRLELRSWSHSCRDSLLLSASLVCSSCSPCCKWARKTAQD